MRIGWLGFHVEGIPALRALLAAGEDVACVITLDPELAGKRSGVADYPALCAEFGIEPHTVRNINDEAALALLEEQQLDVLFVIGWSQIVRKPAMDLIRVGLIGAHASELPHNRGSAPINWTLIRGEKTSGNTLMWLAEGVDSGDIIDSRSFPVTPFDTCATLYEKVAEANRDMIVALWSRLLRGERSGRPQQHTDEPILPRRRPADGLLDWQQSARAVYDMVRGLTRPYPGAFSFIEGQRYTVWQAALLPPAGRDWGAPGTVLGPVVSPEPAACGWLVATGEGVLAVLEVEDESGAVTRGPELCALPWEGKVFADE